MSVSRRSFLVASAGIAAGSRAASAADYPNKPIRLVVGFAPGAATDYVARIMADALTTRLGQNVVVENRTGAAQLVAMEFVERSDPDGYTLMFGSEGGTTVLPAVKKAMPYKMPDAFTYIARVTTSGYMILCNAKLPFKTIQELMAYAKANPGKIRFGTSGVGTEADMIRIILGQTAGTTLTHVPYRGGAPALVDTISGQVEMTNQSLMTVTSQVAAGQVRLLAFTGAQRDTQRPDIPTLAESGYPDAVVSNWLGIMGPAKLPQAIQVKLQQAVRDCSTDPAVKDRLLKLDFDPAPVIGDAFRKQVVSELAEWKRIAKKANVSID